MGGTYPAEGSASTAALKQEYAWHVLQTERRPACPMGAEGQNGKGKKMEEEEMGLIFVECLQ